MAFRIGEENQFPASSVFNFGELPNDVGDSEGVAVSVLLFGEPAFGVELEFFLRGQREDVVFPFFDQGGLDPGTGDVFSAFKDKGSGGTVFLYDGNGA